jgi:hypothetical protein
MASLPVPSPEPFTFEWTTVRQSVGYGTAKAIQ